MDQPVFVNSRGGRLGYDRARRTFDSIRSSRGLDDLVIQDLRHLSLTAFGKAGAALAEIMQRGRHSDMRTAVRSQHASRDRDRALVQKISEMTP